MTDNETTGYSGTNSKSKLYLYSFYSACWLLMGLILFLDLSIPLGVAMSVSYVAVVLISLSSPRNGFTVLIAVVCSVLTVAYIKTHSEAEFSHGICPECAKKLYPEFYDGNTT